jgi:hypothetical protein
MSAGAKRLIPRCVDASFLLSVALSVVFCLTTGFSQEAARSKPGAIKYDLQTETKTKGVVDEVKLFDLGTRKDFIQLVVKSGENKLVVYICPKSFQDELGITFSKGDEITITGAKAKQEEADVILARELVRGQETFLFRDGKGNPVWDWRTGK